MRPAEFDAYLRVAVTEDEADDTDLLRNLLGN